VRQPQVFLMDEPLSNLDAKLRVQMRADIARLQRELGTTTVYVTHDQVEAMTMGDRVAVMSQGVLQQVDVPQRLYDLPANLFVAGFIGTPPMNLLEGTVYTDNGGLTVDVAGQRLPVPDAAVAHYPKLRGAHGQSVVAGVRAGDLHRAATHPDLPVLKARLKLVEALGQESIAYFKIDAHVVTSGAEGIEEAVEEEAGSEGGVTADRPNLVVSLAPHETDQLRLEDEVPVAVNVAGMHFFDAETGEPLR
jgi:multiple sugar transport system ATP-binding protein